MKASKTFALIRMEWIALIWVLVIPLFSLGTALGSLDYGDWAGGLRSAPTESFMTLPIIMGAILIFLPPGNRQPNSSFQVSELEFLFSQPFSRRRIFWVKSAIYLLGCLSAALILLAYSFSEPMVRLSVPHSPERRAVMKTFYLENFPGAQLEKVKEKETILLPRAQVDQSLFRLLMTAIPLLLTQMVAVFMKKKWGIYLWAGGMLGWQFWVGKLLLTGNTLSGYEIAVAWVANHYGVAFLAVGLLAAGVQFACLRRFCRTEVF